MLLNVGQSLRVFICMLVVFFPPGQRNELKIDDLHNITYLSIDTLQYDRLDYLFY